MKKPAALAEMIAKKAFLSAQFQHPWQVHTQAFGPILTPAYEGCYTAKVHLINILNSISRGDVAKAKNVMETLLKSCGCDTPEEKALLCFLEGLCCEVTGDQMGMFSHYTQAGNHGHRFYLLHLKSARFAHASGEMDIALAEYCKALPLIRDMPNDATRTKLLGSTLTNTASCLTYMHRYEDAEALLKEARSIGPVPRIETVEAVLLAAMDREEEMEACLIALAEANDPDYDHVLDLATNIINGHDPHFTPRSMNEGAITAFWQWFGQNEAALLNLYNQRNEELPEELYQQLEDHISPCFPFAHTPVSFGTTEDDGLPEIFIFTNSYSRSLNTGCMEIISACPADIASRWIFTVEH